jgi:CheY-like chemotaxis protein
MADRTLRRGVDRRPLIAVWADGDPSQVSPVASQLYGDWVIYIVRSAEEALAKVESKGADAVVTELVLSGASGIDLLRAVRLRGFALPVIVVTSHGSLAAGFAAARLGAFEVIEKPVAANELAFALHSAIASIESESIFQPLHFLGMPEESSVLGLRTYDSALDVGRTREPDGEIERLAKIAVGRDLTILQFGGVIAEIHRLAGNHVPTGAGSDHVRGELPVGEIGVITAEPRAAQMLAAYESCRPRRPLPSPLDVASAADLCVTSASELLRRTIGMSLNQAHNLATIRRAVVRLAAGTEQVAQIVYQIGLSSPANFDHLFHRMVGLSPNGFRRLLHTYESCGVPSRASHRGRLSM